MSKGTARRTIRIDDEIWGRAQEAATERGDNLSDIIRRALIEYTSESENK
jgi:predicted transcriptional regulator